MPSLPAEGAPAATPGPLVPRGATQPLAASEPAVLSAEVHEFMGRAPHWLLRSGTMALACVVVVLFGLAIVIKYPDTITARITVTGTQPVVEVIARQGGHLESLRVEEGQKVIKGQILAIIASPARSEVVLALGAKLALLTQAALGQGAMPDLSFKAEDGLGRLQDSYAEFLNAYNQLRSRLADDYSEKAASLLRDQLAGKRTQIASLRQQGEMSVRGVALAKEKYERMKVLHERASISNSQLDESEMVLLQEMRADTMAQRALTDSEIEAARLEKELRDLAHERSESLRVSRELLRANLNKLRGEIDVWEADFVLRAQGDGVVAFYDFWSVQQFVAQGRQVFLVVPETTQLVGRMAVNQGGAGKIKPGQTVRVRLDDFPYREFGVVTGKVQSISMVARDGANLVLIDLPHPLVTSFKRTIQFKQEMAGQASIVTEDIRLIGRVLYEIRRAFVNNTQA
ncbi:MAG: HlyD family efflux transporter periplasmic adaptor subunit [Chthoniobacteraceae bacterium]